MSNPFVVFDSTTGEVLRAGWCSNADDIALQAGPGQSVDDAPPEGVVADGRWARAGDGSYAQAALPVPTLQELKDAVWEKVKAKRATLIAAGATVPGIGTFQTDLVSMANVHEAVTGALLAGATGQPYTITFTLADNSRPTLTAAQIMLAGKVIGERKSAIHAHSATLRAAIEAAADEAEIDAIDIETGWPT